MSWLALFTLISFWVIMQFFSLLISGSYIGSAEVAVLNPLVAFRAPQQLNLFISAVSTIEYYTTAIPTMLLWDYNWLAGNYALVKWVFLYPLSGAIIFGLVKNIFFQRNL